MNPMHEASAQEAALRLREQVKAWYLEAEKCLARARELEDLADSLEGGTPSADQPEEA